jgi:hypothetical protein
VPNLTGGDERHHPNLHRCRLSFHGEYDPAVREPPRGRRSPPRQVRGARL